MLAIAQVISLFIGLYSLCVIAWLILTTLVSFNVVNRTQRFVMLAIYYLNRLCGPPLRHIRRHLPDTGKIDLSPIVLLLLLNFAQDLVLTIAAGQSLFLPVLALVLEVLQLVIYTLVAQMIVSLLISFNIVNRYQPIVAAISYTLDSLCEPMLAPLRRIIPPLGMIDFTPLILMFAIGFIKNAILQMAFHL
jgi:YggT family protein